MSAGTTASFSRSSLRNTRSINRRIDLGRITGRQEARRSAAPERPDHLRKCKTTFDNGKKDGFSCEPLGRKRCATEELRRARSAVRCCNRKPRPEKRAKHFPPRNNPASHGKLPRATSSGMKWPLSIAWPRTSRRGRATRRARRIRCLASCGSPTASAAASSTSAAVGADVLRSIQAPARYSAQVARIVSGFLKQRR